MARSIHTTRRDVDVESPARRRRVEEELGRKRRIKQMVARERREPARHVGPTPAAAISLVVTDEHPFLHYPASPDDLRAVLDRLPSGVARGLASVELCLGADAQPASDFDAARPDPHTGRPGVERFHGVHSGGVLGTYDESEQVIRLFGYVYDPNRADRDIVDAYLRLQMLTTFVHELAHHEDKTRRVARGRWTAEPGDKAEVYAEAQEYAWTREVVIPYLEQEHTGAIHRLQEWVLRHSGVAMTLEAMAGDPRRTQPVEAGVALFFTVAAALESLVDSVAREEPPDVARVGFAEELHYGERYHEALAVLRTVLDEHPDHTDARLLCADIYVHQGRFDAAEELASAIVERDDAEAEAWIVLADVSKSRGRWSDMEAQASRAYALLAETGHWMMGLAGTRRALALINLERCEDALGVLDEVRREGHLEPAGALRAVALLRGGSVSAAFDVAKEQIEAGSALPEYVAVRFHAAHLLGIPENAGALSARRRQRLRNRGFGDWLDALERDAGTGDGFGRAPVP